MKNKQTKKQRKEKQRKYMQRKYKNTHSSLGQTGPDFAFGRNFW